MPIQVEQEKVPGNFNLAVPAPPLFQPTAATFPPGTSYERIADAALSPDPDRCPCACPRSPSLESGRNEWRLAGVLAAVPFLRTRGFDTGGRARPGVGLRDHQRGIGGQHRELHGPR